MTTLTDLGLCHAFTETGRCAGRLIVVDRDEVLIVGRCSECGSEAALPVGKAQPENRDPGPDRPEPWWKD